MKNQEYLNYYFGGVDKMMSAADYQTLKTELQGFKEKYLDLPPSEFRKMVREEYSDLITMNRMKGFQIMLDSINKKVHFFMILTIIGLVLAAIAIITGLSK
jgi:hypothetical protein